MNCKHGIGISTSMHGKYENQDLSVQHTIANKDLANSLQASILSLTSCPIIDEKKSIMKGSVAESWLLLFCGEAIVKINCMLVHKFFLTK